jgi:hypothetical protein
MTVHNLILKLLALSIIIVVLTLASWLCIRGGTKIAWSRQLGGKWEVSNFVVVRTPGGSLFRDLLRTDYGDSKPLYLVRIYRVLTPRTNAIAAWFVCPRQSDLVCIRAMGSASTDWRSGGEELRYALPGIFESMPVRRMISDSDPGVCNIEFVWADQLFLSNLEICFYYVLAATLAIIAMFCGVRCCHTARGLWRLQHGRCVRCGYCVEKKQLVCPECGSGL